MILCPLFLVNGITILCCLSSFLLTIPQSVGYEQNPLTVYYCYDVEGSSQCLKQCIAEVSDSDYPN